MVVVVGIEDDGGFGGVIVDDDGVVADTLPVPVRSPAVDAESSAAPGLASTPPPPPPPPALSTSISTATGIINGKDDDDIPPPPVPIVRSSNDGTEYSTSLKYCSPAPLPQELPFLLLLFSVLFKSRSRSNSKARLNGSGCEDVEPGITTSSGVAVADDDNDANANACGVDTANSNLTGRTGSSNRFPSSVVVVGVKGGSGGSAGAGDGGDVVFADGDNAVSTAAVSFVEAAGTKSASRSKSPVIVAAAAAIGGVIVVALVEHDVIALSSSHSSGVGPAGPAATEACVLVTFSLSILLSLKVVEDEERANSRSGAGDDDGG